MKEKKFCPRHPVRWVYARGVCKSCYCGTLRKIASGELTKESAVAKGFFLPSQFKKAGAK